MKPMPSPSVDRLTGLLRPSLKPPASLLVQCGSGQLERTTADSDGLVHRENLTTFETCRELNALAAVESMEPLAGSDFSAKGVDVVYFMASAGLVKVGTTDNLRNRLRSIAAMSGAPVHVIAFGKGCRSRERALHARLSETRHHGEWFRPSPDLVALMGHAAANTVEWKTLPPYRPPVRRVLLTPLERLESLAMSRARTILVGKAIARLSARLPAARRAARREVAP